MPETDQQALAPSLAETPAAQGETTYRSAVSPDRLAWLVLLIGFAMFCLLTVSAALAIYGYLFRSTVAIPAVLHVAQGTVGITGSDFVETVERGNEDLTNTATSISTDSLSQATIQFHDIPTPEEEPGSLLAAVTLQHNTFVTFERASRPRFDWSLNPYQLRLSDLKGEIDVLLTGVAQTSILLHVETEQGIAIELENDGRYRISASEDEVRVFNLVGKASAYFVDDMNTRELAPRGQELVFRLGNRSVNKRSEIHNVLSDSSFSLNDNGGLFPTSTALPQSWGCLAAQDDFPIGSVSLEEFDGRFGMRLRRLDNATSHGDVKCTQLFGDEGLDVSEYDSIKVVVTFYLNYQSLSQCGTLGSECPLMLRIDYKDHLPVPRVWIRGFHYEKEVITDYFTRCSSCSQDHQNINKRVWYTFESENLLSLIDVDDHPKLLESMQFYASGHQFDTVVSEILLLLESTEPTTTAEETQS